MEKVQELLQPEVIRRVHGRALVWAWLALTDRSLNDLAELCDVNQSTLSLVLRGHRRSMPLLKKVERVTGVPAESFDR